ncbi:Rtt106-domain-containing protein [Sodiomyces alkalinus F11]|uniref:Rtt106-domain-containing protein n=1 Tax=Sodiomyces alkalinus (strain CBS 110278 / VKM F-3762 / F11) TaxID=1314773 RepID=A0A3N2PUT5_SODAK|nr:Rtt106-domain-containing protein [Sodiomyces alkalinus F11]ROT38267.1 Rtt106-domain-containing protein [Sodiomyces alkalinus F11]
MPIMAAGLDSHRLGAVFHSRPDIIEGIKRAADSPGRVTLFNNIANFVYDQINGSEPAAKRRRVDNGVGNGFTASNTNGIKSEVVVKSEGGDAADEQVLLEIKELSVSVPQRKKFDLCFTENHFYARAPGTKAPVQGICHAWTDIEYAFYLPVPEKAQVQHNYILFPRGSCLPSKTETPTAEPLVFTIPATAPKQGTVLGPEAGDATAVSDSYRTLFDWALTKHLRSAGNPAEIVSANPARFHSMARQPHRPNEKAVHVKAFRGSKDGYLFFLPNGILWGFKKPLLFVPLTRIAAVSYTSVLQRTFNMVVEVFTGEGGDGTEELEFAMLDQEDYRGIDEAYVRRNGLQDRSMAEQRRAKMELAENMRNGKKGGGDEGDAAPNAGDGLTELERAQAEEEQRLQDEEDEEEEDYDPGSEGDSEGEGETSDEGDAEGDDDADMEEAEEYEEDEDEGDERLAVTGR